MQKSVLWEKKIPQISSKFLGTQPPDEGNAKLHGGWRCLPSPPPEFSLRSLQSQPSGRSVRGVCLQAGHTHSAGMWGTRLQGRLPTLTAPPHPPSVPTRSVRTDCPFPACFYLSKGRCVSARPEPRGRGPCRGSGGKNGPEKQGTVRRPRGSAALLPADLTLRAAATCLLRAGWFCHCLFVCFAMFSLQLFNLSVNKHTSGISRAV